MSVLHGKPLEALRQVAEPHGAPNLHDAVAYGCQWVGTLPLACFESLRPYPPATAVAPPQIEITDQPDAPVRALVRLGVHLWRAQDGLRYVADDGTVLDSFEGRRVVVSSLPAQADLPSAFYGTVTGTLLAWRGLIPIHGSAVEWKGQAVLLCGPSGSGKSTAAAALISRGARLLSDDLSVLHDPTPGSPLLLYAGRTFMRLYPATADALASYVPLGELPMQSGSKRAVTPPRVDPWTPMPLCGVVYLGPSKGAAVPQLSDQLYRPQAMRILPGQRRRLSSLLFATPKLRTLHMETGPLRSADDFTRLGDQLVHSLGGAGLQERSS